MSTRGAMQTRIKNELRIGTRFDAESTIPDAINTAIAAYRHIRFPWSETRTQAVFNTVAAQEFYGVADVPAFARLKSIDYVFTLIGTQPQRLRRLTPEAAEWTSSTSTGQPLAYSWYEEQMRLYPLPSGVYSIRVAGVFQTAAPVDDSEAGNPWMIQAETLIRCRAKGEIALHRMRDPQLAVDMLGPALDGMGGATGAALSQLRQETTGKLSTGCVEPYW